MYKIGFYVPESHLESVKTAMFIHGGGAYADYDMCSWQVLGEGQFRPAKTSHPFHGTPGSLEKVAEYRVEMICSERCIHEVIQALRAAHPYEEPAYHVIEMKTIEDL